MLVNANANNLEAVKAVSHMLLVCTHIHKYIYSVNLFLTCFLSIMLIMRYILCIYTICNIKICINIHTYIHTDIYIYIYIYIYIHLNHTSTASISQYCLDSRRTIW